MLTYQNQAPSEQFENPAIDMSIYSKMDQYDRKMGNYLARLYYGLSGEIMDLNEVKSAVEALQRFNQRNEIKYGNNLLYPEISKGCKIPSPMPVPSCSFQLHNSINGTTNSLGNVCAIFNPFFGYDSNVAIDSSSSAGIKFNTNFLSSLWINNSATGTGAVSDSNFIPTSISQAIPAVYNSYRLVSASVIVKYIGRLDHTAGVVGGAIVYDKSLGIGCTGTYTDKPAVIATSLNGHYNKYGNFDLAMDSFYHQENMPLEGLKMGYFPLDTSYENYVQTNLTDKLLNNNAGVQSATSIIAKDEDSLKSGFNFLIYTLGAPPSTTCFKMDIYCNFECLPSAEFLNYMPVTPPESSISQEEKIEAVKTISQQPIKKASEESRTETKAKIPTFFEKMVNKFSGKGPSIAKMIANKVIGFIPGIGPAAKGITSAIGMLLD